MFSRSAVAKALTLRLGSWHGEASQIEINFVCDTNSKTIAVGGRRLFGASADP